MFDGVLFDFSGTLFDDRSVLDPAREAVGDDTITRVLSVVDSPEGIEARRGCDVSHERHRAVWTALIAEAGPYSKEVVGAIYSALTDPAAWKPYPDTARVVTALHERGTRIGVLSNIGWDIRPALADAGVLDVLDTVVLSCEHGVEKPDPTLFTLACDKLGLAPGSVLYVGDDPVKDGAAVKVGMPVYLLPTERSAADDRGLDAVLRLA
ncbi:HAD family hydrolase [Umezawaea endophytica]|uniref:HAD-IA family hydrolase n=1 Tax=Umezawaea endophytica TaxID=1654476 RepID=A0A9X3A3E3_9PSEU|nr:HAD-IA family hydrolase [Umezawaea endophytica]MCS7480103.1 HAD-IA family hydrolase [Umezawaea endophytica]